MVSPYVRRQRLAAELRKLREERGMMADELAKRIHYSRMKISRLENAHGRPDVADVIKILDTLGVAEGECMRIVRLASAAAERGWWDRFGDSMGVRQKLYADLEFGADTIRDYDPTGIPAVLQNPDFIEALINLDRSNRRVKYAPSQVIEARRRRQSHLLRPDGPSYDTVLDEFVILRLDVPPGVMIEQLRHMVQMVSAEEQLTVRFLRYNARITGGLLPKSSFALYTFPVAEDPDLAVVDTITTDLVHTDPTEVASYKRDYERLQEAALSPDESLAFLTETADQLANEMRQQA
ncbi:helix-turn-helix domain-containing protein [Actinomadura bangladeshensis]|uniref:XRE family transcriptional regulator n=1 Tax=Actinomadura bangladeshensis TaxID=453573 RepID=A0A4R4NCF6_9ACTN|nr:helix-turn-helix transcriptional regulator [Actinomadura bangladeshensis]TDC05060.1 XRE family transcriptional regulator [Actinomadura bangladeshensis]